jgi:glucose/arabinose dehydrogenase
MNAFFQVGGLARACSSAAALAVALSLVGAASAAAQQAPPAPAWAQGRPAHMADSPLKPHATGVKATPASEIPLAKIKVPAGFKVELWAHGIVGGRTMARGDKGTIFMGTRGIGRVYAVVDHGDRREPMVVAEGLTQPNGVAFRGGSLYVAAINRVLRYDGIEDNLKSPPKPVELTDAFGLPPDVHHNWKFLAFGPDGKLYVQVGSPCNICGINPEVHGQIRRYNADGSGMEIVARGVRNSVGFDFHPKTGELWFTDNGRDWMGDDGPEEELNRVSQPGEFFGFPYCHANGIHDADIRKPNPCAGVTLPVVTLGAHAAALGMRFYSGQMFPAAYKDRAFVARRGSWNRTVKNGYDVVAVSATPDGKNAKVEPFMTGFLDAKTNEFWGRPVYVLQMPDGALLVSDEQNGAIYRVTHGK